MKKNQIRMLVGVMLVALIGLLLVQWSWVRNAVTLKETQFRKDVSEALYVVAERLQEREMAISLFNDQLSGLSLLNSPMFPKTPIALMDTGMFEMSTTTDKTPANPESSFNSKRKSKGNTTAHAIARTQHVEAELVNGKWIERKNVETVMLDDDSVEILEQVHTGQNELAYAQTVIRRMLHGTLPLRERLDPSLVDTMIKQELGQRAIDEPYVYSVSHQNPLGTIDAPIVHGEGGIDHGQEFFKVRLFPHDIMPGNHYLELQFPERKGPMLKAMGVLLPTSGVLVLIVVLCFGIVVFAWQRQQKLSTLKTDFINNMTHELKTPISTISLALEALGDPDMLSKDRLGLYTRIIKQENERLKTHVERVLQAAAFERGELKLDMQPLDVDAALQFEIGRIRLHVEGRQGTIEYFPEATQTEILADPMHLGGLVFNLLDNANKYSPQAPHITVRTRNVLGGIEIEVTDQGIGMTRDSQKRIFEKFYRVPTGNVHDVKGFGLGLNYAASMAKAHGGDIHVRSEIGKGSTFIVFIPQKTATT
jgi:two-component system, OmpR family, phosphate regulon sensor histidine kinase PhoR